MGLKEILDGMKTFPDLYMGIMHLHTASDEDRLDYVHFIISMQRASRAIAEGRDARESLRSCRDLVGRAHERDLPLAGMMERAYGEVRTRYEQAGRAPGSAGEPT